MGHYSPESARDMSPDTMSSLYPDRPIRPLPKRRLRERLSPDVAESIKFPPAPKTTTPLFYYPFTATDEAKNTRPVEAQLPSEKERVEEIDQRNYISRRNPEDADSDEDERAYRSRIYPRHTPDTTGRAYRFVEKPDTARRPPQPPGSTTSSADGYDSFENTNNKKKRKIPTPGDSGMNGSHLSSDMASMGISSNTDDIHPRVDAGGGVGAYYSSPVSTTTSGLSGPGRGRYGRMRNGRSPLRALSESNWSNGRSTKQRQPQWPTPGESTGIISNAIANAEKLPVTPSRGQENVSLLQQQASKKSSPASAQFTFTCDSQVPGTVTWPKPETTNQATMGQSPTALRMSTQATQTSPGMTGTRDHRPSIAAPQPAPPPPPAADTNGAAAPNGKKTRRKAAKEYRLAALQRRQQQAYQNYHHPPAPEDIWICEFCEYESIFGERPVALMRQYEIKDRKEKRKAEEKRRLLEKAKMKGRKGKKGSKNLAKNNAATNPARQSQQPASQPPAAGQPQSRSNSQSEEYYEDDFDDEYVPTEGPRPLSPSPYTFAPVTQESGLPAKMPDSNGDTGPPLGIIQNSLNNPDRSR